MNSPTTWKFRFQQRYPYFELTIFLLIVSIIIASVFPSIFSLLAYDAILRPALRAGAYLNLTALTLYILYRFIKRELMISEVGIRDDQFAIKRSGRIISITFSEIKHLKYIKLPFFRGFIRIDTVNTSFTLPLYIENLPDFISKFYQSLQRYGNASLLDNKTIDQLTVDCTIHHKSFQRSLQTFKPLLAISLSMFITNIIIANKIWGLGLIPLLIWALIGLVCPTAFYIYTELRLNKHLRNNIISGYQPPSYEYIMPILLFSIIYLLTGIFVRILFTWN